MALELFQKVKIRLGDVLQLNPSKEIAGIWLGMFANECMYTLLWMYSVFSLLVIQSLMRTQAWSLRGPWVSSQTVKCSVSVPSHGVPSALGFVMTCTDISAMLSRLEYQADQQTHSQDIQAQRENCVKVCYFVHIYALSSCKQLLQSQFSSALALT